jgi:hypothetical protein
VPEPSWTYDSAKKVYERLAPKPTPEPRRVTAARKAFERVNSREARDLVAAELIRSIPADVDPETETRAILALQAELDAADDATAHDAVLREVEQALAPERSAEPDETHKPYRDDYGNVRNPSGRVIDPASEDWWGESWANDAAELLGPAWLGGANPGEPRWDNTGGEE